MARREIIEAGAGCGKTHGLVSRYVAALGIDPKTGRPASGPRARAREILALTFTEDAAREMLERVLVRLEKLEQPDLLREVLEEARISTFHSLCARLIRPHLETLGYEATGRILAPTVASKLRRQHLLSALRRYPSTPELLRVIAAPRLLDLGEVFWFRPLERELEAERELLDRCETAYSAWRAKLSTQARAAFDALPAKDREGHFLIPLLDFLEGRAPAARLREFSFNARSKAAKLIDSEILEAGRLLKEAHSNGLLEALESESRAEELKALDALFGFLRVAREGAPRVLDYDALEAELSSLLESAESRGDRLMPAPKLILVDEFQDTNERQYSIVSRLAGPETDLYLVGDPKQSIYAFRKADVRVFLRLRASPELNLKSLETNYRSDRALLAFFNLLSSSLFSPESRPDDPPPQILAFAEGLEGRQDLAEPIRVFEAPKKISYAAALAKAYRTRRSELGPGHTHAALFTSWQRLHRTAAELTRLGVPVHLARRPAPLKHLLTPLFASYLRALRDPEARFASYALEFWRVADPSRTEEPAPLPEPLSPDIFGAARAFCRALEPRRFMGGDAWSAALFFYLEELAASGDPGLVDYGRAAECLEDDMSRFEAELEALETPPEDPEALRLMTVHGSKGLQFSAVYLPEFIDANRASGSASVDGDEGSAFDLRFPSRELGKPRLSLLHARHARTEARRLAAERRRLFYVALTRAQHSLDLFFHTPGKSKPKADPLVLIGAPEKDSGAWNRLLVEARAHLHPLESSGRLRWTSLDGGASPPEEDRDSEEPPEAIETEVRWAWPCSTRVRAPSPPFFREGVSRYLERNLADLAKSGRDSPGAKAGTRSLREALAHRHSQTILGTRLHELLEFWDGSDEHLEILVSDEADRPLRDALLSLRAHPELAAYFRDLRERPGTIRKEFGLFVRSSQYRLSGFADVLWCPEPGRWILLDWKSSKNLAALEAPRRKALIHAQLELYSRALNGPGRRIEAWALGIVFEPRLAISVDRIL